MSGVAPIDDGSAHRTPMYSHCVHCHASLGGNELLEAFPVGTRIAFDADKGRLWVVCRKCERWNLAPFESRWEAIEAAERAFRGTTVRQSTDNIGLAQWRDGTTLIRVGRPLRPEFAAWRYGDQFGRRRRRAFVLGGGVAVGAGLLAAGAMASGVGVVALFPAIHLSTLAFAASNARKGWTPLAHPDGGWFLPIGNPRLVSGGNGPDDWAIELGWVRRLEEPRLTWRNFLGNGSNIEQGRVTLRDELARDTLAQMLPRVNVGGAPIRRINDAVDVIDTAGGPERVMQWAVQQRQRWATKQTFGDTGDLAYIPKPARLAIEMAVHEERERLALQGELAELERAWLEAERIARIADKLVVPSEIEERLARLQQAARPDDPPRAG